MGKPIILTLDDDVNVLRAIERDLRKQYSSDYRVLRAESGASALELVEQLKQRGWDLHTWVIEPAWQALREAGYNMDRVSLVDAASPPKRAAWEFARFPRIVRRRKPDVVFQFSN